LKGSRHLRKALDDALGSKEALRETMAMEVSAKQRAAEDAEERHRAHERRLLSEVDRERMATNQAAAELAKAQKARAVDAEAARTAILVAQQTLHEEQAARRDAVASASRQVKDAEVELATLRERSAGADERVKDLTMQLQRQGEHAEREITQLRESQATTAAALRQIEARSKNKHGKTQEASSPQRTGKSTR
jgi:hypothetical protein